MHILLMQNNPCIKDLSETVIKKYPKSSVITTNGYSFPTRRPVLTDKWLIRLNLRRAVKKQITEAAKIEQYTNFIFVGNNRLEETRQLLNENGFKYQVVDNLRPDKILLAKYVEKELGTSLPLAQYIVERSNRYEPLVIKNIQLLALVKYRQLSRIDIDKYLQDNAGVSFSYLYNYILLGEGEYKKVIKLIYRYQTAPHVLCKYLIEKLEQDYNLFLDIIDGNLSKENHTVYAEKKKISEYTVKQSLFLFNRVTLETLLAKRLLFESLLGKSCIEFIMKGCK